MALHDPGRVGLGSTELAEVRASRVKTRLGGSLAQR